MDRHVNHNRENSYRGSSSSSRHTNQSSTTETGQYPRPGGDRDPEKDVTGVANLLQRNDLALLLETPRDSDRRPAARGVEQSESGNALRFASDYRDQLEQRSGLFNRRSIAQNSGLSSSSTINAGSSNSGVNMADQQQQSHYSGRYSGLRAVNDSGFYNASRSSSQTKRAVSFSTESNSSIPSPFGASPWTAPRNRTKSPSSSSSSKGRGGGSLKSPEKQKIESVNAISSDGTRSSTVTTSTSHSVPTKSTTTASGPGRSNANTTFNATSSSTISSSGISTRSARSSPGSGITGSIGSPATGPVVPKISPATGPVVPEINNWGVVDDVRDKVLARQDFLERKGAGSKGGQVMPGDHAGVGLGLGMRGRGGGGDPGPPDGLDSSGSNSYLGKGSMPSGVGGVRGGSPGMFGPASPGAPSSLHDVNAAMTTPGPDSRDARSLWGVAKHRAMHVAKDDTQMMMPRGSNSTTSSMGLSASGPAKSSGVSPLRTSGGLPPMGSTMAMFFSVPTPGTPSPPPETPPSPDSSYPLTRDFSEVQVSKVSPASQNQMNPSSKMSNSTGWDRNQNSMLESGGGAAGQGFDNDSGNESFGTAGSLDGLGSLDGTIWSAPQTGDEGPPGWPAGEDSLEDSPGVADISYPPPKNYESGKNQGYRSQDVKNLKSSESTNGNAKRSVTVRAKSSTRKKPTVTMIPSSPATTETTPPSAGASITPGGGSDSSVPQPVSPTGAVGHALLASSLRVPVRMNLTEDGKFQSSEVESSKSRSSTPPLVDRRPRSLRKHRKAGSSTKRNRSSSTQKGSSFSALTRLSSDRVVTSARDRVATSARDRPPSARDRPPSARGSSKLNYNRGSSSLAKRSGDSSVPLQRHHDTMASAAEKAIFAPKRVGSARGQQQLQQPKTIAASSALQDVYQRELLLRDEQSETMSQMTNATSENGPPQALLDGTPRDCQNYESDSKELNARNVQQCAANDDNDDNANNIDAANKDRAVQQQPTLKRFPRVQMEKVQFGESTKNSARTPKGGSVTTVDDDPPLLDTARILHSARLNSARLKSPRLNSARYNNLGSARYSNVDSARSVDDDPGFCGLGGGAGRLCDAYNSCGWQKESSPQQGFTTPHRVNVHSKGKAVDVSEESYTDESEFSGSCDLDGYGTPFDDEDDDDLRHYAGANSERSGMPGNGSLAMNGSSRRVQAVALRPDGGTQSNGLNTPRDSPWLNEIRARSSTSPNTTDSPSASADDKENCTRGNSTDNVKSVGGKGTPPQPLHLGDLKLESLKGSYHSDRGLKSPGRPLISTRRSGRGSGRGSEGFSSQRTIWSSEDGGGGTTRRSLLLSGRGGGESPDEAAQEVTVEDKSSFSPNSHNRGNDNLGNNGSQTQNQSDRDRAIRSLSKLELPKGAPLSKRSPRRSPRRSPGRSPGRSPRKSSRRSSRNKGDSSDSSKSGGDFWGLEAFLSPLKGLAACIFRPKDNNVFGDTAAADHDDTSRNRRDINDNNEQRKSGRENGRSGGEGNRGRGEEKGSFNGKIEVDTNTNSRKVKEKSEEPENSTFSSLNLSSTGPPRSDHRR